MSEKDKKTCKYLNYVKHLLILVSTITVPISSFTSLVAIPAGIASLTIRLGICAVTTGIKNYKSIINKKKKKHDKILLLEKTKLNAIFKF